MNLAHLDPVSAASMLAAACLALTRLFTTAKPVWDRLPKALQGLLPVFVLALPVIAAQAAGVKTSLDLVNLLVLAVALILPGMHSHTVGPTPPANGDVVPVATKRLSNRPPTGFDAECRGGLGALALLALPLLLLGCSRLARVDWSQVAACVEQPAESALLQIVSGVLAGEGDVKTELEGVALQYGPGAVKCAVEQLVSDLGAAPLTARASRQVARGRAFFAEVRR